MRGRRAEGEGGGAECQDRGDKGTHISTCSHHSAQRTLPKHAWHLHVITGRLRLLLIVQLPRWMSWTCQVQRRWLSSLQRHGTRPSSAVIL